MACHQNVGVGDAVGLHQLVEADPLAIGDVGEGVSGLDGDTAAPGTPSGSGATTWQPQALARSYHVWVADAIGLHQSREADAVAVGNFREGFAWLHHHVCQGCGRGQTREGQHHS